MTRWLPRFVLATLFIAAAAGAAFADSSKLDFFARTALANLRQGMAPAAIREEGVTSVTDAGDLDCFIVGNVTRAQLEAAGARVRTAIESVGIFTAFIPAANVDAVAAIAGVQSIQGAQIEEAQNDASVPTTGASLFRGPGPTFTGLNGAGVIVGNVDTGVDYHHDDFKTAGGNTRFLKIWDQTDAGGPPAAGFGYGSDWSAADMNALTSRAKDTNGHGSHTMGTEGGDGSQTATGSAPAYTYAGMAPMADLIAVDASVSGSFTNTAMLDGINYIFQQATIFGEPAVANLSIGGSFGPHDGSSAFEVAVDALTGPGRIVAFSSGNDRGAQIHGETNATPGGADITMTCNGGTTLNRHFQLNGWHNATETINCSIITPNGTTIGPIAFGANSGFVITGNGQVYLENGASTSTNGSREVLIDAVITNSATQTLSGTWTFRFTAVALGAANGLVDLWRHFLSSTAFTTAFVTGNDSNRELINAIGTGSKVITVGAWTTKKTWTDCFGDVGVNFNGSVAVGNLSPFSSMGPTRDGRQMPQITAPGSAIASVQSHDFAVACPATFSANLPGLQHVVFQGTSMAAPHASGAAGLFMEKYGALTPAQVMTLMQQRAVVDGFTGATWNKDWGYGKLNLGDMSDPLCAVTSPNGGEINVIGSNINLTWNASDTYYGVTAVDLELSRTGVGGPYTMIASGVANTGSFPWTVTGPATNNAILRVTARDAAGNAGIDVSDQVWAIVDQPVATTVALFRSEPSAEGVRLVWQFTDPSQFTSVAVERAVANSGPWTVLDAPVTTEGANSVALDRTAAAGLSYYYRLDATYRSGQTATFGPIQASAGEAITEFALKDGAPNPTAGPTLIEYAVPKIGDVRVSLYDLQGREVAVLASGHHPVGRYQVTWSGDVDGGPAAAGVYFLHMKAAGFAQTRRIVVSH
ncbi:MAG: S8 family peptidase [Candidatus Eisenbacteria bacterium]|nr:S8 family peptidase [Candidatus Eisenbacteria bacterium]